jgi:DNA-binding NarL/FixJ family response regulator
MAQDIRIFICEDDNRTRAGLRKVLSSTFGFTVAGEAPTAEEALLALQAGVAVDLLLLDLEMPGMGGMDLLEYVKPPPEGPEVLILTTFSDADRVFTAIRKGAAGYLVKGGTTARLTDAIREVCAGGTVIEPRLAKRFWNLFEASVGDAGRDPYGLTPDELEVLHFLARGLTNPELGSVLKSSRRTIKLILEGLYKKMGVKSRVEAVVNAVKAGLVKL